MRSRHTALQPGAHPMPHSYWVGRLLAGEYPGEDRVRGSPQAAPAAGRRDHFYLDLTEEDELEPYAQLLQEEAAGRHVAAEDRRAPIADLSTPPRGAIARILAMIDDAIAAGRSVYIHCWGGIGRTGTIVGCYLVRHG